MTVDRVVAALVFDEADFRRLLSWEIQRARRYQDFVSLCLARPEETGAPDRAVLDSMARWVVELLRSTDVVGVLSASVGIILVHTPQSDAVLIAERMQRIFHGGGSPAGASGGAARRVLRLGLASFPSDATSDTVLLERAQARLAAGGGPASE